MSLRWRAVGKNVSDLTGPRFEPLTFRSRDERVTLRPTYAVKFIDETKFQFIWNGRLEH